MNLSKSGVSASIGRPGATINVSERGTRGTVGIPGTGLSYSERLSGPDTVPVLTRVSTPEQASNQDAASSGRSLAPMLLLVLVLLLAGLLIVRLVAS